MVLIRFKTAMYGSSGGAAQSAEMSVMSRAEQPAKRALDIKQTITRPRDRQMPPGDGHRVLTVCAVLPHLEKAGWLVPPLANGCRATELNKGCKKKLQGCPGRLQNMNALVMRCRIKLCNHQSNANT